MAIDWDQLLNWITALGAIGALVFTGYQIMQATNQLEANVLYNIKKDGRDLYKDLFYDNPDVWSQIFSENPPTLTDPTMQVKVSNAIGQIVQFYITVYGHVDAGYINERHLNPLIVDFCEFATRNTVRPWTEIAVKDPKYDEDFREALASCLEGRTP